MGDENEETIARRHKSDVGVPGGFGTKRITMYGSWCLNLNNCMGPAMVLLPLLNQQAGWFTPTLAMIVAYVLSSLACTMLCESMQRIPGNRYFTQRVEFATLVRYYYGRKWYLVFQVLYNLSMQATNIAAMIISAQVVDRCIARLGHKSYALDFEHMKFAASKEGLKWCDVGKNCEEPRFQSTWVISLGYLACMAICIPFGYLNLDDNMWFQWFSLGGLLLFTTEFFGQFIYNMVHSNIDNDSYTLGHSNVTIPDSVLDQTPFFVASTDAQSQVIGISIFAYAYVVTIPSWVNEKKAGVNVNVAVWVPATVGLFMKLGTGLLGAWAFASLTNDNQDIVKTIIGGSQPKVTIYSGYLWDITTLIPGIPVLAVMIRYNLLSGGVCGRFWSFFWGVIFPWIATAFCYEKGVLTTLCNWVAIIFQGYINFVVPAILYRSALKRYPIASDAGDTDSIQADDQPLLDATEFSGDTEGPVNAIPRFIHVFGKRIHLNRILIAEIIIVVFTVLSTAAIIINIIDVATN